VTHRAGRAGRYDTIDWGIRRDRASWRRLDTRRWSSVRRNQASASGGARGSAVRAWVRETRTCAGESAQARICSAIAGRSVADWGVAPRERNWQSAHSSGCAGRQVAPAVSSMWAPGARALSRSSRASANVATEGSANCSTAQRMAQPRNPAFRRMPERRGGAGVGQRRTEAACGARMFAVDARDAQNAACIRTTTLAAPVEIGSE